MLKIGGEDSQNGVAFINIGTGEIVEAPLVIESSYKKLIVTVPNLHADEYTLQVTTQMGQSSTPLQSPRVGTFAKTLEVI